MTHQTKPEAVVPGCWTVANTMPIFTEVLSDRGVGDTSPSFATEMTWISGELPPLSSATFCTLAILGGSDNTATPSLGQVDLTPVAGGKFQVDSFFDVSYKIVYAGCPGSILDGISGVSDVQSVHTEAFGGPPGVPSLGPGGISVLVLGLVAGVLSIRRLRG